MDKVLAEHTIEVMQDLGIEAELREDYSGRGMFGHKTTGIITSDVLATAYAIGQIDEDGDVDILNLRYDSIGMQSIVY